VKITDKVNKVLGVYDSFWNGKRNQLTVYYYGYLDLATIKVRIADCLKDNLLDGAIEKIILISVFD
jgi:hypothetical protein